MNGEYGLKDIFFGVPVQLGRNGIEKIVIYDLVNEEREALNRSAEAVQQTTEALRNLIKI
jgi:malate dehydrogenase